MVVRCSIACGLALLLLPAHLPAQERFYRLFDVDEGLNPSAVRSLAQDRAGFLWIGTEGGLVRYDGVEMRRWSPDSLDRTIVAVATSPGGSVTALREGGALFAITSDDARSVRGPAGEAIVDARDATFDVLGDLWVVRDEDLWRRDRRGVWSRIPLPLRAGERPTLVRRDPRGGVLLATTVGAWRIGPTEARRILEAPEIVDLVATADGRVLVLGWLGELYEVTPGGVREVLHSAGLVLGRAISLAERGSTVWISIDRYLLGWKPGGGVEVLGVDAGIQSGGPLLVDHEGSLWMGSFIGLYQFPEPGTRVWTETSGLPSNHSRYLARVGDTVWLTTWQGGGYVREGLEGWDAGRAEWGSISRIHVDSRGVLWAGTDRGIVEVRDGRVERSHGSGRIDLVGLVETPDGAIWLGTSRGLFRRDPSGDELLPVAITVPGESSPPVEIVLLDRRGDLWLSSGETVCRAPVDDIDLERDVEWRCDRIPGAVHLTGLVEMPGGAIWASTNRLGVLRRGEDSWAPLPGLRDLPSRAILSLVPSRSGGLWIVGHGVLHRVMEVPGEEAGWRVVERLTHWHGLPAVSGTHLMEDADGGVWVTTSKGVVHLPAQARFATPRPPRVALVDVRVDDERIPLGTGLELPHDRNRLELRFAGLSYRDPSLVRYQVRLSEDDPWVTTSGQASFRWVDLSPGEYRAQVRASLDGETWSPAPAAFAFRVAPPWYRRPWAIALYAAAIGLVLYAAYRLRVAHLLDLERQRTRIAMDLHDDIGSGLGSIGILSGILATDGVADRERREMAREIAATSGQLGAALSQIVWTLDPKVRTMEEVAGRLAELGRRLFAGDTPEFMTRFPDRWPDVRPSELVRRNLVLIGLEALHNAARHARAERVGLRLLPLEDGKWELSVTDDGVGLDGHEDGGGGLGLRGMRRRAEEIGAELEYSSPEGGGTVVKLVFHPGGPLRRPWARRTSSHGSEQ